MYKSVQILTQLKSMVTLGLSENNFILEIYKYNGENA